MPASNVEQLELTFTNGWGGKRKGAGRTRNGKKQCAAHDTRPELSRHHPVHVCTRMCDGLPNLRNTATRRIIETHLARGADRFGFHLIEYSIQTNHIHLVVECEDRVALWRGMKGLLVRIARALNEMWGRKGQVFRDRYFARALTKPLAVRTALVYVLQNARKHGSTYAKTDEFSSGPWFEGWKEALEKPKRASPCLRPRTWLLKKGWKRRGLIGFEESPRRGIE